MSAKPTPIMAFHQVPSLTRERYQEVVRQLTNGKPRFESSADVPFDGLLVHVAAETESGFLIFDVFESQEAFDRFGEQITPIARSAGIEEGASDYEAHTFIVGNAHLPEPAELSLPVAPG